MASAVPEADLEAGSRPRLSRAIAALGFLGIAALGSAQLLKDGSFWIDEASVALSLMQLEPLELFGPLVGGQSFPRLYLFAIRVLTGLLGYETMVARTLPFLFFLAASLAWVRLLYLRFREEPALVALGLLLLLVPAPWFVYAAILKAYTLDVLLAAVPFLLRDDFYDATLERGESPGRLLALTALGALSYPYAMALLARCGGWWLTRAAAGRPGVSPRGVALGLGGVATFAALVWVTDLRHTETLGEALRSYWSACRIGAEGTSTLGLLDRFAFGWFDGRADFSREGLGAAALLAVEIAFGVGVVRLLLGLLPADRIAWADGAPAGWGSRSVGCAVLLAGLPLASWWLDYPICAGRLTLFSLLPLVLVVLEGFSLAGDALRRLPYGRWPALLLMGLLLALVAPTSYREAARRVRASAPDDLRPLLERVAREPHVPILSNTCTRKQIETLPEGLPGEVFWIEKGGGIAVATRKPPEAWLLYVPEPYCRRSVRRTRDAALTAIPYHEPGEEAQLFKLRFPDLPAPPRPR